jgi:hypothetical protein
MLDVMMRAGFRVAALGPLAFVLACSGPNASTPSDASSDSDPSAPTGTATIVTISSATADASTSSASASTGTSSDGDTTTGVDTLPPVPELVSPSNGSLDEPLEVALCWEPVIDADGDEIRYRVFVDDIELQGGVQAEEEGYAGPCTDPLTFEFDRTYAWRVRAFEAEDPTRESESTAPWTFTIEGEAGAHVVFLDRFDDDMGWEVGGDASAGAWVRGDPQSTFDGEDRSQPSRCDGGVACWFTGNNPAGVATTDDVDGGSTTLTSPPFDLSGAAAATVEIRRFFYRSDSDAELRIELLVPDDAEPGGFAVHPLELLDDPTSLDPHNVWTPRELAACGVPMVADSRLRITATDDGDGILEAAIDTVRVRAHDAATVCGSGEGGMCDPSLADAACPDDLLCCARGSVQAGVFRCGEAVAGLDPDMPPPEPDSPGNGPLACDAPDLRIDESWIDPVFTDIMVNENTCELLEGCVDDTGVRTILRFSLAAQNGGSKDLVLGVAANNPDVFHYSECHDHHHFDNFAIYELLDGDEVVARGHKQAFCLLDSYSYAWPNAFGKYDCGNQGISRGFADIYESDLPCQWIDVTDVPPGEYTLRAEINPVQPEAATQLLVERDYGNNVVTAPVTIE